MLSIIICNLKQYNSLEQCPYRLSKIVVIVPIELMSYCRNFKVKSSKLVFWDSELLEKFFQIEKISLKYLDLCCKKRKLVDRPLSAFSQLVCLPESHLEHQIKSSDKHLSFTNLVLSHSNAQTQ